MEKRAFTTIERLQVFTQALKYFINGKIDFKKQTTKTPQRIHTR